MSESFLLIENFDVCRICLTERHTEGYEPFVPVMTLIDGKESKELILNWFKFNIKSDDGLPNMICKCCFVALDNFHTLMKTASESNIVLDYIAKKRFGRPVPETSVASTSSLMLRNNEESSHSMPGTSEASTSTVMLRNNEVSSQEPRFKNSRVPSNKFRDSMPGTSKASTSIVMLKNNEVSSQEPPFKHSRVPSQKSNKFSDSMPGTSKASTSSLMLTNNEESSHGTPLKSYRSISKRSNEFGDSMPGTSKASTSSMMLRKKKVSFQEPPFKHSQSLLKQSNMFGDSIPGTSKASTSSLVLRNNGLSSQEPPFKNSQLSFKQSNMFGDSIPGTSKASTSSLMLRNNEESSHETPLKSYQSISKRSNKIPRKSMKPSAETSVKPSHETSVKPSHRFSFKRSKSISNPNINNVIKQEGDDRGIMLLNTNNFIKIESSDESDDDSCIITTPKIDTVILLSDDEIDDNDNIENVDLSDYEETVKLSQDEVIVELSEDEVIVELSQDEVIVELSSDSEDNENNIKKEYVNKVTEKLYYCSICQKKNILNHDCSQHTKSFFTCLVPGCNMLSRSKKDFTFHYQPHIGMSSSGVMCHRCFKGIDQSNIDGNGCHIHCDIENAFRCYLCNIRFKSIQEFAHHKLKTHNGILMDAHYNYLCLHCEESSPDIQEINDHMNHCLESQAKNEIAASMKPKKETELLPVNVKKENVMVRTNGNNNMIPRTSQHVLFTCLKPSCNLIFLSFSNFKNHHRHHFELGNALICWQCCKPCSDVLALRAHQVKNNCRTPGLYKCYSCSSKFDDLESLSIHKLTFHESELVAAKKNRKTLMCTFCQMDINIFDFKSHLVECRKKDVKQNTCTTKNKGEYTCLTCEKVFMSSISLSNHSRVHKRSQISNLKQEST